LIVAASARVTVKRRQGPGFRSRGSRSQRDAPGLLAPEAQSSLRASIDDPFITVDHDAGANLCIVGSTVADALH